MRRKVTVYVTAALLLTGCSTIPGSIPPDAMPGFFSGVWHGLISVITLVASFFTHRVTMYGAPNSGPWYDLGFLIGVVAVFGVLGEQRRPRRQRASEPSG